MSNRIHKSAKPFLVLVLIAVVILAAASAFYHHQLNQNATQAQAEQQAVRMSYDTALINACLPQIQEAVDDFYADYLSISPTVANYVTVVENVTTDENGNNATVVLTVGPYVGPHDTVGSDQITLAIQNNGDISVEEYKHLYNYALPEHLADLIIQPLPGEQK